MLPAGFARIEDRRAIIDRRALSEQIGALPAGAPQKISAILSDALAVVDAFSRIMGAAPAHFKDGRVFKASWIDTVLGPMIAVADDDALYLLEFVDRRGLEREIERLRRRTKAAIIPGCTAPLEAVEAELRRYFDGGLPAFTTPVTCLGTPFQQRVWDELRKIPAGQTRSYTEIAEALGTPNAVRAVARANGANQLAILIPCHRVIGADGSLTGYGGGLTRKNWLINHERQVTA